MASANLFTHANEPVLILRPRTITFSSSCLPKLSTEYVELLFNPVERMLAVRPCSADHANAIRWSNKPVGATAFCRMLFGLLNWDEGFIFRVPSAVLADNDQKILFFDLDNFIGHER